MNLAKSLLVSFALIAGGIQPTSAAMRISDDRGGRIGKYLDKFGTLATSGQSVIIDGECLSACTMVLGAVPHDKICVTTHASLGFHGAYDRDPHGRVVPNQEATRLLYAQYPYPIRQWLDAHGGLKSRMIFLRGKELMGMYRPCSLEAQAAVPR
jgi:hypothetical protein